MKFNRLLLLFIALSTLISCSKNENIPSDVEIQSFVWKGLNAYYLWQGEVSDLSDRRFSADQELYSYLQGFSNPENLFESLLFQRGTIDRFSWIVDDYIALENSFQSIRVTSGLKLKGADYADGSGDYYVYVYDVVEGSDAAANGATRGMIITEVNGTKLTRQNVNSLFGNDSFTIHLADFNAGNPVTNASTITVNKTQVTENPIKEAKVITNGSNIIGYLMYNQFSSAFDGALNTEFANFKNAGITDLIIDLRYNGGGSVKTATYLGSMITGLSPDNVFSKQVWNNKVQANSNPDNFINNFTNRILNRNSNGSIILDETINSLGLNTVYFIVSDRSASASELVINALKPYIDVKLVGIQTYGKHVGSITLYDSDDYSRNGGNLNMNHTWAMQPIVLEIQNKNGMNKPDGFIPEITMEEAPGNLGVIGDPTEPLLERTIQYIVTGARGASSNRNTQNITPTWNSMMHYPDYNNMYVDFR